MQSIFTIPWRAPLNGICAFCKLPEIMELDIFAKDRSHTAIAFAFCFKLSFKRNLGMTVTFINDIFPIEIRYEKRAYFNPIVISHVFAHSAIIFEFHTGPLFLAVLLNIAITGIIVNAFFYIYSKKNTTRRLT